MEVYRQKVTIAYPTVYSICERHIFAATSNVPLDLICNSKSLGVTYGITTLNVTQYDSVIPTSIKDVSFGKKNAATRFHIL